MSSFLIIGMSGIVRYLFYNQVISPNFKSFREEALLMAFDPYTIMFRLYYKAWAFVMHI